MSLMIILLIIALICFCLAAFGVASRVAFTPLGLAFCVLAQLLGGASIGG